MRILLIEDEPDLAEVLAAGLEEAGYSVDVASDGVTGEAKARRQEHDLLVVDWVLPGKEGPAIIRSQRASGDARPMLMLTARTGLEDRVGGLDAGADDYLTKPFAFEELFARLRALQRRARGGGTENHLDLGPLRLDVGGRQALVHGRRLDLRSKELAVLELLARRPGMLVTRTVLAERVWGTAFTSDDAINVTVSTLRRKLTDALQEAGNPAEDGEPVAIETVRGAGYRLIAA